MAEAGPHSASSCGAGAAPHKRRRLAAPRVCLAIGRALVTVPMHAFHSLLAPHTRCRLGLAFGDFESGYNIFIGLLSAHT